jgi:fibronectin type III domain protein
MTPRHGRARRQATFLVLVLTLALGALVGGASLVLAQTAQDPSDVVLVFDVSDSILESDDGTNVEFAAVLDGIADRVATIADDLSVGNATVSFVAFGRTARPYPAGCQRLALHDDPAAVSRFEDCLRQIATEYAAGRQAPVKQRINTAGTDHVAALAEAADLLSAGSSRSAVIFFTDGKHDPPGTDRDDENVVAKVTPSFAGRTPLAILPVGLGTRAGRFESDLQAIYAAFLRDMAPCEGRGIFRWPEVVFPSGDAAGAAVALALQEVTCSFTVAPTPTPAPTPTGPPPDAPIGVQVLAGNKSLTIQWLPPSAGKVVDYLVRCRPAAGGDWIDSGEGVSTVTQTVIEGLEPGIAYDCEVAATDKNSTGPYTAAPASTIVLGIPGVPGQPRAEPLDAAARLSVDPVGGVPVEQYVFECTNGAGQTVTGTAPAPTVVVTGLVNGATYQCVARTQNRIGRSEASIASASFAPCAGVFGCNPWAMPVLSALVIAVLLVALVITWRRYANKTRIWVTAQVDGGANRSLGWGHEHGIGLDSDDAGLFASSRPIGSAPIRIKYQGKNRFMVESSAGIRDVHQGDPAPVRVGTGEIHQLTVRLYKKQPRESIATPIPPPDAASVNALGARLGGGDAASPPLEGEPPRRGEGT